MSARTSLAPPSVCLKAQLNAGHPSFLPVCFSCCVSIPVEAPAHADPCHQDTCKLRPAANDIIMCFWDQVRRTPAMLEIIKSRHSGRAVQRCVHQGLLGCGPRAQGHRAEARQGSESEAAARLFNQRRDKREESVSHPRPTAQGLATNQARKPGPGFKWHLACHWDLLPSPGSPCLESSESSVNALATANEKEEFLRTRSSSQAHWLPP